MAKEKDMVKELKKKNKRIKKALRSYRCRFLKNLIIWLMGVFCLPVFLFGGVGAVLKFVPLITFTGGNQELLSPELSQESVIDAIMSLNKYGVDDMPVVRDAFLNLVETSGLDKFIAFDQEKFTALKFSYTDDRTFASELKSCVTVVASLNSLGVSSMIGDLANVSVFKEYKAITLESDKPNLDAEGNIAKDGENFLSSPELYYYQASQDGEVVYKRAFDDQGVRQCGLEDQLYFPNIADIPVLNATQVMTETMAIVEINELLSVFGAGETFNDSFLGGILEGKRIGDLSEIKTSDFLLKDILGEKTADNEKFYDILITGATPYDIDGDGVIDEVTYDNLNLEHVKSCNVDNITLSSVMPITTDNEKLYDILVDVSLESDPTVTKETLAMSHLTSFNIDNLHLNKVIEKTSDNQKLFDILTDATGKTEENLILSDLSNFNVDNLHLSKVMPDPNEKLKAILVDAFVGTYPDNTYENIKLSDLSGSAFSFDNIKLATVIGESSSNPIIATLVENDARIGTISSDIDNLSLYDIYGHECFIPYNESLHSGMLRYNEIKDLDGNVTGYTQDDNGAFVIDKTCGVWLLLCFDGSDMYGKDDVNNSGRFKTYTISDEKMCHLQEHVGEEHSISNRVTNATIRQLIDIGILSGADDHLYHLSLQDALNFSSLSA